MFACNLAYFNESVLIWTCLDYNQSLFHVDWLVLVGMYSSSNEYIFAITFKRISLWKECHLHNVWVIVIDVIKKFQLKDHREYYYIVLILLILL